MALAFPPILVGGMGPEVLDDDLRLLGEVGGMQGDEPGDGPPGLAGLVSGSSRMAFSIRQSVLYVV